MDAFDEIEAQRPEKSYLNPHRRQRTVDTPFGSSKFGGEIDWSASNGTEPSSSNPGPTLANDSDLQDDPDNPFTAGFTPAAVIAPLPFRPPTMGFTSAAKLPIQPDHRSPSPEEPPPGLDVDAWFNPAPMQAPLLFTTAKSIIVPDFTHGSMNGAIKPSSQALAKAKALLEVWESEDVDPSTTTDKTNPSTSLARADPPSTLKPLSTKKSVSSPQRIALRPVENVVITPGTPLSSGFSHASMSGPSRVIPSPSPLCRLKRFRSPLLKNVHTFNSVIPGSPLNPNRPIISSTFNSAASQLPCLPLTSVNASPGPTSTPRLGFASPSSLTTPLRSSVRPSGVLRTRPAPFVTPFKPGMRPGEPGRSKLSQSPLIKKTPLAANAVAKNEISQNWLTKDRLVQQREFFSLGWCTSLVPHTYR